MKLKSVRSKVLFGILLALTLVSPSCTVTKIPGLMTRSNFGTKQMIGEISFTVSPKGVTNIIVKSYNSDVSAQLETIVKAVAEGAVNGMKTSGS